VTLALDYTWLRTRVSDSDVAIDELPNEAEHAVSARALVAWRRGPTQSLPPRRAGAAASSPSAAGPDCSASPTGARAPTRRPARPADRAAAVRTMRVYVDALNVTNERRWDSYGVRGTSFVAGVRARSSRPCDRPRCAPPARGARARAGRRRDAAESSRRGFVALLVTPGVARGFRSTAYAFTNEEDGVDHTSSTTSASICRDSCTSPVSRSRAPTRDLLRLRLHGVR
jgi:hypothetical protein